MRLRLYPGNFFGTTLKRREIAGFLLSESTYVPGTILPRHSHERAYFCLVLQGAYTQTYGNHTRLCKPATVVFHPEEEAHADRFLDRGGRLFSFEIEPRCLQRARSNTLKLNSRVDFSAGIMSALALRLYREFRFPDEVSLLAVEGLFLELMAEAARSAAHVEKGPERKPPGWLIQAKELIHARFVEPLTHTVISESVNVHPVHLAREFRRYHACTIGEYLRWLRLEFACREIASTDDPFIEIAAAAGFSDHGHFSRSFKRFTGMTPTEYRTHLRSR